MFKNKKLRSFTALFLAVLMLMPMFGGAASAAVQYETAVFNPELLAAGTVVTSVSEEELSEGILQTSIVLNNEAGNYQQKVYAVTADVSDGNHVLVSYKNYDAGTPGLQTVRSQVKALEKATGENVVAAVNGMAFNTSSYVNTGIIIMNGKDFTKNNADTYYYFAVLNDGSAVIRDPGTPTDDVKEGLSVWQMLVDNGEVLPISDSSLHPRTAIGVRYDGTVVLVCVDGRQSPISCGATLTELAYIMKSLGCVRAGNLDGGSSTTMLAKNSCGYEVELVNSPCYVAERQVASAIVITAPEKEHIDSDGDGYCDVCGDLENEFISRILRIFLFFFDLIGRIFEVDLTTRIEHKLHK